MKRSKAIDTLFRQFGSMRIIDEYWCLNFYEFTCNQYGDVVVFRVYEDGSVVTK